MSGGHYGYKQHDCRDLADQIRRDLARIGSKNEYGDVFDLTPTMVCAMTIAAGMLEACDDLVHDIDWALSGDTSQDDMPEKLARWMLKAKLLV